jgi:hypothetical protein
MALGRPLEFCLPIYVSPGSHDALDVFRRAGSADGEQPVFGLTRRHARQRANLGVRQLPTCECLRKLRQRTERARHAHVLACRARSKSHAPRQPRGA